MINRWSILALTGRFLMALLFLAMAFGKVTKFGATVEFMERAGLPLATLLCAAAAVLEAAGGIALLLGFFSRWAAGALAAFVAAVTVVFHSSVGQEIDLLKNLAIIGGLLQVMAFGPGEISLEGRRG